MILFNIFEQRQTNTIIFGNHGGFLHSQFSPVRREKLRPARTGQGKPLDPAIRLSSHSLIVKDFMENKQKGRPPKEERIARRNHFSVWVTKDEKAKINQLIEKSGLSASQFFLTLALDTPIRRPQRRTLPARTADMIRTLEQLSGIMSLAVLKTKDYKMQSQQWMKSSQNVRLLSQIITQWVFEDFEIRTFHKALNNVKEWMQNLRLYIQRTLPDSQNKKSIIDTTENLFCHVRDLLLKYEAYYQPNETVEQLQEWESNDLNYPDRIHRIIEEKLTTMIKRLDL